MKVSFRIEGGKELADALNRLPARVGARVKREVLKDIAEPMRARMGQFAPRAPGAPDIADNMVISNARFVGGEKTDAHMQAVAVGPATGFYYSVFLEYGTVHMSAQPFARPAFDAEAPKALQELSRRLWVELAGRGIGRTGTSSGPISGGSGGSTL